MKTLIRLRHLEVRQSKRTNSPLGEQLAHSLTSLAEGIRHEALKNVIYCARCYGDRVDLKETIPPLLAIYENDVNRCFPHT